MDTGFHHVSVLLNECIEGLNIRPDGIYVDGTAGGAGHSREIAKRLTTGRLIAVDKDPDAIEIVKERLKDFPTVTVVQDDFKNIPEVLERLGIEGVDGVLLDLGVSSHQFDTGERGFSYNYDGPLDMRMSQTGTTAADIVNNASVKELTQILRDYGEEKFAFQIAKAIERTREKKPIETTFELCDVIKSAIPAKARREGGNPCRQTFQALRIAVNGELDALSEALDRTFFKLNDGGRFAIISFHSLEDRLVKTKFAEYIRGCTCPPEFPVCICGNKPKGRLVNKKPILPTEEELERNNRSRSAKLRVIERTIINV